MESKRVEFWDRIEWQNDKGKLHRLDGHAVEWGNGDKYWCINDKYHREDGPAIEWIDGDKEWWLNGIRYREEEYKEEIIKLKLNRIKDL